MACVSPVAVAAQDYSEKVLLEKIKAGGYVLFFRHGKTQRSGEKSVPFNRLNDCTLQRNLSDEGRHELEQMAVKTRLLPVDKVFSSPYCRTRDTAEILFGRFEVKNQLAFALHMTAEQRTASSDAMRELIGSLPAAGKNNVLVSHTANLKESTGFWPKQEGEMHVFQPLGQQRFKHLGIVRPASWQLAD